MGETAIIKLRGQEIELPVIQGTEKEVGIDISELRTNSGIIMCDKGYANTGSTKSAITFVNGEKGILRYRGYAIEDLVKNSRFTEVCYLL